MKIALVTNDLGIGGVQRLVVDFANAFERKGIDVTVITLLKRPASFFYQNQITPGTKHAQFEARRISDIKTLNQLTRFFKQEQFDVVFTQLFLADTIGRIAAWRARTPLIVTEVQNVPPHRSVKIKMIEGALRRITDLCLSTTPAVTEYAHTRIGFPKNKIIEIPTNAVDEKRFEKKVNRDEVRKSLGIPTDKKAIITIGRLVEQKGHATLIAATKKIIEQHPNTHTVIIGSGEKEQELRNQIKNAGLEKNIHLPGVREDTPELLKSADIFAFPSLWEGQGVILFEAIFAGIPIVASNTGGIPEVIENEHTGLLAEPGDENEWANNLARLIEDEELGRRLAHEARSRFNDRTITTITNNLESLFKERLTAKRNTER